MSNNYYLNNPKIYTYDRDTPADGDWMDQHVVKPIVDHISAAENKIDALSASLENLSGTFSYRCINLNGTETQDFKGIEYDIAEGIANQPVNIKDFGLVTQYGNEITIDGSTITGFNSYEIYDVDFKLEYIVNEPLPVISDSTVIVNIDDDEEKYSFTFPADLTYSGAHYYNHNFKFKAAANTDFTLGTWNFDLPSIESKDDEKPYTITMKVNEIGIYGTGIKADNG